MAYQRSRRVTLKPVDSRSNLWRAVAALLLLISAFNFITIDLQADALLSANQSSSDDSCTGSGHDCFACCAHIIPPIARDFAAQLHLVALTDEGDPIVFPADPIVLFHPPKA